MKLDEVKLKTYKYQFKSVKLTISGSIKHDVEPSLIFSAQLIENYDEEVFPFFLIDFGMPNNVYRKMIKPENSNNIVVDLDLQKAEFEDALNPGEDEETPSFRSAIKGKFHGVISPEEPELTESEQDLVEEEEEDEYGQISEIEMLLYPKDFYDNYQTVVNNVLYNTNLTDALVYVLTNANINNILLSPSDNSRIYNEFKIVPLSADEQLQRICNEYNFHKNGTIIHFSYDYGYIIDKVPACTAYYTNEFKNTYVVVSTESQSIRDVGGSYSNGSEKYNVVNASKISVDDSSDVIEKTVGSNVVTIDIDGNPTRSSSKLKKVTKVVVANEGSATPQQIQRAQKEAQKGISVQMTNIDITMLRPNKQFIVSIEGTKYKKYNGKYRMKRIAHVFEKEGDYFSVSSIGKFNAV